MHEKHQKDAHDEIAALNAQIEHLKHAIVLLQGQFGDMREQKDSWQSKAERVSLVAGY